METLAQVPADSPAVPPGRRRDPQMTPRRLNKASTEPVRTGLAGLLDDVIFRNSLIISRIIYARKRSLSAILFVQLEASLAEKLGFYEKP
jgi:hypothetical protein